MRTKNHPKLGECFVGHTPRPAWVKPNSWAAAPPRRLPEGWQPAVVFSWQDGWQAVVPIFNSFWATSREAAAHARYMLHKFKRPAPRSLIHD